MITKSSAVMFSNFLIEMKPSNSNLDYRNIYSSLTDMTTYNESVFSSIKYDSATYPMSCDVTISHVQINCSNIPPGTGTHNITVEVGNQISSISPTSVTYNPPIVSSGISALQQLAMKSWKFWVPTWQIGASL